MRPRAPPLEGISQNGEEGIRFPFRTVARLMRGLHAPRFLRSGASLPVISAITSSPRTYAGSVTRAYAGEFPTHSMARHRELSVRDLPRGQP
jgi:hypothetical protein